LYPAADKSVCGVSLSSNLLPRQNEELQEYQQKPLILLSYYVPIAPGSRRNRFLPGLRNSRAIAEWDLCVLSD
jgi:hypothetical protein